MRWWSAVACALALAGCGGAEENSSGLADAARHLDPRADTVAAVSLDYEGEDWHGIKRLYARAVRDGRFRELVGEGTPLPPTLDGALNLAAGFAGLSFENDVRPLLGGTVLIAARSTPPRDQEEFTDTQTTVVYRVPDPEALGRVVDKLRKQGLDPQPLRGVEGARKLADGVALVGDDTLVAVDGGDREGDGDGTLRDRARGADGPPLPQQEGALLALRAGPGWLANLLTEAELRRARETSRAGRALRDTTLRLDVADEELRLAGRVDFEGLPDDELPLGEPAELELPVGVPIASASSDQQRTTVFLARLARELVPDSRFVERVEALERKEDLRFEDEVLRMFSGPSATIMRVTDNGDTEFGARSSLADPDRMRKLLPRLAPALPGILEGLQGLGRPGLSALLFVAPDAPLVPSALLQGIEVRLAGADLYEVRGLDPHNEQPTPDTLVYGLVDDVFVVGSTKELALQAATAESDKTSAAGTRIRVDLAALGDRAGAELSLLAALFSRAELAASPEDGDIVFDGVLAP